MTENKSRQDATESTRGTVYHLCVAVQKCYELREDESVLLEELGDITTEDKEQVEIKQYSDTLTDGHLNFWNTLRNWMDDSFNHASYSSLVLHTTQEFGPRASIAKWNESTTESRIHLLRAINASFEEKFDNRKAEDEKVVPSSALSAQRYVLESSRTERLQSLVPKVWIEARSKTLPVLYEGLKQDRIKGIPSGQKGAYLDSLLGFVCRPDMTKGESWEITYEMFDRKLQELNSIHSVESRIFPSRHFHAKRESRHVDASEDLFVQKIRDIDYPDVIPTAIHHYQAAILTIDTEFQERRIEPEKFESYSSQVVQRFNGSYRKASRNCRDVIRDSQDFYDETLVDQAPDFPGFHDSPDWFRNGLLHAKMDNGDAQYKWKLTEDE